MVHGEPWFVAKDVCDALGLVLVTRSLSKIPDNQKGVHPLKTRGGTQQVSIISEAGLYRLVMRSDKPEAEPFIVWVTEEVLPTIRKTGGIYMTDGALEKTLADPDFMIQVLQNLKQVKRERDELQSLNKAVANERDNARDERDEAVRTKACISDRKTATALQTASVLTRKVKKLEQKLGIEENFMQARAIPWLKEFFGKKMSSGAWVVVGQQLSRTDH